MLLALLISILCLPNLTSQPVLLYPWSAHPQTTVLNVGHTYGHFYQPELQSLTLEDVSGTCIPFGNNIFRKNLESSQACTCHEDVQLAGFPSYSK